MVHIREYLCLESFFFSFFGVTTFQCQKPKTLKTKISRLNKRTAWPENRSSCSFTYLGSFMGSWGRCRANLFQLETAMMCSFYCFLFSKRNWFLSLAFPWCHDFLSTWAALNRECVLFPSLYDNFSFLRLCGSGASVWELCFNCTAAPAELPHHLTLSICAKHAWMGCWNAGRRVNTLILTTKQACSVHSVRCRETCWSTTLCTACVMVHLLLPLCHIRPIVLRALLYEV